MGHKFDTFLLVWTSHVFRVNWLRLFLSVFCTLIFIVYCSLLCGRRSIDRTALNLCVFWYISRCLVTRGLSRFALLASAFTPAYFSVLTSGIRSRINDGVRFCGSINSDWSRLEGGVHLDGCSSSRNLFGSNEDFVGEIIPERFSVLRHKFFTGGYGEEKQAVED